MVLKITTSLCLTDYEVYLGPNEWFAVFHHKSYEHLKPMLHVHLLFTLFSIFFHLCYLWKRNFSQYITKLLQRSEQFDVPVGSCSSIVPILGIPNMYNFRVKAFYIATKYVFIRRKIVTIDTLGPFNEILYPVEL